MSFKMVEPEMLTDNPFKAIGRDWMLITAGTPEHFNTMTASWGQMGVLWGKNVLTCYIRPNRYTYEFIENNNIFTASVLDCECRKALQICGSKSGRDCDKVSEAGLTPVNFGSAVSFEQARLVLVCRKLYSYDLSKENFLTDDGFAEKFYSADPLHRAYISEISEVYVKE